MAGLKIEVSKFVGCVGCVGGGGGGRCGRCGWCGRCGGVGLLLTFDIPQTALVATLDTYDFIYGSKKPLN
jgi:hypothetical protein